MVQAMTEQELFQAARANYEHLVKICERLELDGYWEKPQKIIKQPIILTLTIYVQSVLVLYTVYAKCLTPQMKLWLRAIAGEDAIRVMDIDTNENILKLARKITYSPPILLQLCGLTDRENGTETACIFLDSMLNMILIIACQAGSSTGDMTRFIQEYYRHIQVFLNQDTANEKMNTRYLFRKLSCERIEDSLCLYIEDKQRIQKQKKIKEDLKRLELSENKRRRTHLEKEKEEKSYVSVSSDNIVWEQKEQLKQQPEQLKEESNKIVEKEIQEKDNDIKIQKREKEKIQNTDSIFLEISEHRELLEIVLQEPIIYEKSIAEFEVLNINERSNQPKVKEWASIKKRIWKDSAKKRQKKEAELAQKNEKEETVIKQELKQEQKKIVETIPDMEDIKKGFHSLKEKMEAVKTRELDHLLEELNSLIGLESVKEEINSLINLIKVRKMREKFDMPMMDMTYHMVFTGSPGTGKTTVARLMAKIYKELGILSKGNLVETDRSGLVAGYIGQTAIKVKEVVESALGGVLFIDEAYSLTNGNRTEDFGSEVIDTLVKLMEDHRDDLVVITAGYTKEMKEFLKSNSGLVSRFNKFIEFSDYTDTELLDILDSMAVKAGFHLQPLARIQLGGQLGSMTEKKRREFGNARGIRNVFEKVVVNQANRIVGVKNPTKEELTLLTEEDVYHVIL